MIDSLPGVRGVAFDLDGTVYQGSRLLPGANTTITGLRQAGCAVRFLTNTTSKSRSEIVGKLIALGLPVGESDVFSPPFAAGEFLRRRRASAHLLVLPAALPDFEGVPQCEEHPDFVVVGDLAEGWTSARLNFAFRLLYERGAQLIGLGRTRFWQTDSGLQLDAGAFVAALEYASGQEARIFGKPDQVFFHAIAEDMGCGLDEVAVVGDDIVTDVGGAMAAGLRGVLVQTGKFRPADLERGIAPNLVIGSLVELLPRHAS